MTSAIIIGILILYLLVLLLIGQWATGESDSMAGYYVAGKRLPSWVIAFGANATGESAWLLLGLTGMGYVVGVHALWVVLGEVLGVTLGWVLVARPFKEYTDRYGSITVPDYLESRFGDATRLLRLVSVAIIFSMVAAYTAAQLTASGKAFNSFLGMPYATGVIIGTVIVLYYTTVGGYKAVAYTDLLQGVMMFLGLLLLPLVGIAAAGGWRALMAQLQAVDPALLRPMGDLGSSLEGMISAVSFVGIGLAFLGVPQILVRYMSARDQDEIVSGSLIAVICIVGFDVGAVFAGMAGRALFPGLADPEAIMPTMSAELFPAVFTGLFLVVVLAAIMSTVSSLLILASSAVVRDVIQRIYRPGLSDRRLSFYGKLTTGVIGAAALVVALAEVRAIFWFVLFAWSGLAAAFTPVILCSLFWKRTTRAGAIAGMIGGFSTAVVWVLAFKDQFYDLYEMIPGFAVGLLLTIVVSLFTEAPEGAEAEFDAVRAVVGHPFRRPRQATVAVPRSTEREGQGAHVGSPR